MSAVFMFLCRHQKKRLGGREKEKLGERLGWAEKENKTKPNKTGIKKPANSLLLDVCYLYLKRPKALIP